ncbi:MAG: pyridoxal-phosphate dependent enzyme, partial [Thermoleophilia bacterium]|nr:pyridoxal-phosphate dependent enzyme [Thermoleophilia bacterium]
MEPTSIPRDDIERAVGVIAGRLRRTPTLSCEDLGPRHFLKAELLQRTGSFKPRGMLTKLASLTDEEKARGIVTWSAGNAAQGAAFAAAENGVECKVFMWATANPLKVAATRALGAEVDLGATGPADAHERLLEYMEQSGRTFVHPFDDPVLQAGHGTLGLEIVEDVPDVATIVVPVGGGGLIAGVASAVDCTVVGVEPEGAPTLSAALSGGSPVRIEPSSIADGLNAPFTGS